MSRWFSRPTLPALAGLICLVGGAAWLLMNRVGSEERADGIVSPERAVAVLSLRSESGRRESAWMSSALPEILATEIGSGEIETVSRESVERMQDDLNIGSDVSHEALARIRANVGADLIVVGSYSTTGTETGGRISISLKVLNAVDGSTVSTVAEEGSEQDLIALARRTGSRLREQLSRSQSSGAEEERLDAAMPKDVETLRLYAEGLARLRSFDMLAARSYLERAVAADPSFALPRAALSDSLSLLGDTGGSLEQARIAWELSARLPARLRLVTEETYLERKGDWDGAASICGELIRLYPSNLDYGLSSAYMLARTGRLNEAFAELERLRRLAPPRGKDPRIDLAEAWFADEDAWKRIRAARRAAAEARSRGARTILAMAYFAEANGLERVGQLEQASERYDEAGGIRAAIGDRSGMGNALCALSSVLVECGQIDEAVRRADQACKVLMEAGDSRGLPNALRHKGAAMLAAGRVVEAEKILREAEGRFEGLGEVNETLRVRDLLASVSYWRGDLTNARALYEATLSRDVTGIQNDVAAEASAGLASVLTMLNEIDAAQGSLKRAIELRRKSGDAVHATKVSLQMAALLSETGEAAKAHELAADAARRFSADGRRDWEAEAHRIAAVALRGLGRTDESRLEIDRARSITRTSQCPMTVARIVCTAARLATGPEIEDELAAVIRSTAALSLRPLNLEARLVRTLAGASRPRETLDALAREAKRAGWLRLAGEVSRLEGASIGPGRERTVCGVREIIH